ncbi:MAG TPA: metal ABC transporter permease [Methylomirabilota bacterium]|nr:metal ABC transporter permease [Methylomirabilota bacterium]
MIDLLALPFLACLILTGIHAYLGLHVLARGVIFVDLALAQVAALGLTVALLGGHPPASPAAYWYALAFAVAGGLLFAVTRVRQAPIPQEAIIGIVYAVSAALTVLVVDRAPQGSEHIKQLLVGSILTVSPADVAALAALYTAVGVVHWWARRPLLAISFAAEPDAGTRVVGWDALFYASFALVVTSSVRLAGVLLVFSFLVVPAAIAALLARGVGARLALGWAAGALVSAAGLLASYRWDLPTGATVVAAFGAALAVTATARGGRAVVAVVSARGPAALAPAAAVLAVLVALAGALLAALPGMDHPWLDAIERAAPSVQETFLTPAERAVRRASLASIDRDEAQLREARALARDVQWGARTLDDAQRHRLAQFLAGRGEIAAGDRLVLGTLRGMARERQRWRLGLPLAAVGAGLAVALARRRPFRRLGQHDAGR